MRPFIGSHASIRDGLIPAVESIREAGGNVIQIYTAKRRPRDKPLKLSSQDIENFKRYVLERGIKVAIHGTYIINLAREWNPYNPNIQDLIVDMKRMDKLGQAGIGVVVHMGAQKDMKLSQSYNNMFATIIKLLKLTKTAKLLLETPAGQGSQLCYKLEDFAYFYKKISKLPPKYRDRVKICVDTCHIFVAGYDIRDKKGVESYLNNFEKLIGLKHIALIHLNDSMTELESRSDRHESIGKGNIGYSGLRYFIKFFTKRGIPLTLETPGESYKEEIPFIMSNLKKTNIPLAMFESD